jgi:hypothetical protein
LIIRVMFLVQWRGKVRGRSMPGDVTSKVKASVRSGESSRIAEI